MLIGNRVAAVKLDRNDISRFVEKLKPNLDTQHIVAEQMVSETPRVTLWRTHCF